MNSKSKFMFKWRGAIMAIAAVLVICAARPSLNSFIFGLSLTLSGELMRLWALGCTGEHTRSQELKAPELITEGPYAVVRNPLYLGNILNALGLCAAACGNMNIVSAACLIAGSGICLYLVYASCISAEENFLAERFGEEYYAFRGSVPALIPQPLKLIKAIFSSKKTGFAFANLRFEISTLIWLALIWSYLAVKLVF
ncbi:MAG: isoprenylcysteine carboxylmethyltransferase family protein [bacterium]|nr:isoprenylcysteine carboxylmethyltransferase family protein [bacterium]